MTAPEHKWVPLMDNLYWVLADYRMAKRIGLKAVAGFRRRALELIAEIKGAENA